MLENKQITLNNKQKTGIWATNFIQGYTWKKEASFQKSSITGLRLKNINKLLIC